MSIICTAAWWAAAPFVPIYLGTLGASVALVGVVLGVAGIVPLLISIPAGVLSDKRGPAFVAECAVVLFAAAGVLLTGVHSVWAVAIAYTLLGVGNIGFAVAPQAVVAAVSDPAARLQNFGYYSLWSSAGAVVGPLIGGAVASRFGYNAAFALLLLLMLPTFAAAAALRGVAPAPRPVASVATAPALVSTIVRQRGVGAVLFISFMVVCGQSLQQTFYPIYLHQVGLTETLIGVVFAAVSLSSMAVRSILSHGVERFGHAAVLLVATACAAVSLGITPLLQQFWPLVLAGALMGASTGFTMPMTMSLMVEPVPPEYWGVAFGIRQGVQRLASVVSPIVFGLVITDYGIAWGFALGALTLAGAIPIMASTTAHLRNPRRTA
jgi:MFS family permease